MSTNHLTRTNAIGTMVQEMDATVKKLMKRLEEIEREEFKLRRERDGIRTALSVVGIVPAKPGPPLPSSKENEYRAHHTFAKSTLTDACLTVLRDHKSQWMTKNQVEYLVVRGGFPFNTNDVKNSVNVTLRRLASDGKIDAKRVRGSGGNTYCYIGATSNDVNSGATK